jgi:tripartite-type tricarboxylate transporter receptor subunit TctC
MLKKLLAAGILVASSLFAMPAAAQTKAMKMIVGFPPGQATELVARILAEGLGQELGHPVVVVNMPGQGGSIAMNALVNSPADGSVITVSALAAYAINPHLYKSVQYDTLRDVAPVALVADIPVVLVVNPSVKAASFAEFVALARANPGMLTHSSSGNGTVSHLGMVALKRRLGVDMLHVPYPGSARAMTDLLAGQVQAGFDSVAATKSLIDAGKLRPLAVASLKRLPSLPDVPTLVELGLPGFEVSAWTAVSVPAATPKATRERLSAAVVKIVASPQFAERIASLGMHPRPGGIAEFDALLRSEHERWGQIVRESGAKVD